MPHAPGSPPGAGQQPGRATAASAASRTLLVARGTSEEGSWGRATVTVSITGALTTLRGDFARADRTTAVTGASLHATGPWPTTPEATTEATTTTAAMEDRRGAEAAPPACSPGRAPAETGP